MKGLPIISPGLKVFLCHGKEDAKKVADLYSKLREDGLNPWLDKKNLLPGQDWDSEIRKAVKESHAILVCLSETSVSKEGYIQKEIRLALDVADEKPDGTIFIIPVRLSECNVPTKLSKWNWVDYFAEDGYVRLLRALRERAIQLNIAPLPGDGRMRDAVTPLVDTSGRVLYQTSHIRELIFRHKNGELMKDDIPLLSPDQRVGISFEALQSALEPFVSEERRNQEKQLVLRLIGIGEDYEEWEERNAKIYGFRNIQIEEVLEMHMIPVRSSNLKAIGYLEAQQILRIEFLSGSIYEYYGIPKSLFDELIRASSHGTFLSRYIKNAGYSYKQIG